MNLFSTVLSWFSVGGLSKPDEGAQVVGQRITTDAGISVNDERAMQISAVWACVQYITNSVCSLPIEFYRKTKEGRKELDDHYLIDLFHVSPNAFMKPRDFRKAMTMQLCHWSNAYAQIFWNGDRPVSIVPLRPGRMTPYIEGDGLTYHYQTDKGVMVFDQKSIFHLKGFGPDGIMGMERTNYARETLGLSVSADTYAARQFAGGGRSGGGLLMFDEFLTKEQREQARTLYEGMNETAYNKNNLTILEGGAKYDPNALNPDTLQMLETRKMQLGEIARFYGVPEVLIGANTGATSAWPASFEQQLLSFLTFTLQDYLDEWETAINSQLLSRKDQRKLIVDHDTTGFIKMDSQARAQLQSTWVQNGLKTRNEIRKMNNDPEVEGGDDLTVQVNLTPLDELDKINEPTENPFQEQTEQDLEELRQKNQKLEEKMELKAIKDEIIQKIPEKADPVIINNHIEAPKPPVNNLRIPAQKAPIVKMVHPEQAAPNVIVQNDVHVPQQPNPIVKVENEVNVPESPPPDVNVTNNVEVPKQDRKITIEKRNGKTIGTIKDED